MNYDEGDLLLFQEIVKFLEEHSSVDPREIQMDTRLEEDLGITGDDAEDLCVEFFSRFNVDPEGFDIWKHFHGEADDYLFFFSPSSETKPLKISDLVSAARRRRWRST